MEHHERICYVLSFHCLANQQRILCLLNLRRGELQEKEVKGLGVQDHIDCVVDVSFSSIKATELFVSSHKKTKS